MLQSINEFVCKSLNIPLAQFQIDERINISVKQNVAEAAERQKDKIIPLSSDVKTPQLPTTGGATNPKDKAL